MASRSSLGANVSVPPASDTLAGTMSAAHYTKVAALAAVNSIGSGLSLAGGVLSAVAQVIANATQSAAGLMSAADKTKLDGVAAGATANITPSAAPSVYGGYQSLTFGAGYADVISITLGAGSWLLSGAGIVSTPSATTRIMFDIVLADNANNQVGQSTRVAFTPSTAAVEHDQPFAFPPILVGAGTYKMRASYPAGGGQAAAITMTALHAVRIA